MKKIRGFTLLELIIVISLIGIVLGVGMIKLNFSKNYNERLEVNTIVNTLNYARKNAINTGENHIIDCSGKNIILYSNIERKEIKLASIGIYNKGKVEFTSTGAPKEATTLVYKGKKEYTITIEVATGKVNLYEK